MTYNPVTFSLPGAGVIAVVGRQYETLDDAFIQQWMVELILNYRVSPDYLLLSAEARHDLYRIVMSDLHMFNLVHHYAINNDGNECYPNRASGTLLTLVVFPGLPEKTLFAASALKILKEEVRIEGTMHIETRKYGRMGEQ